ncbi:hypothetical protein ITX31_12860 [Arthrobacter gandavensis]|uniref:hypothetical protein n=1 Tax=Arthrobacter gandavensis TaxID=169960 RepID=UPI00188F6F24|nr:hypothetical protein [Arthrobacter gandavensis]MBF4994994.1 hypothetical protein [Arthrobacter gandavensis]
MKNIQLSLALAAISAALTLKSPSDWPPAVRRAYVLAPGAAVGIFVGAAFWNGARKGRKLASAGRVDLVTPAASASGGGDGSTAPLPSYVRKDSGPSRRTAAGLTAIAAAAGVASSAFLALGLLVDERIETWLIRRGAERPRRVMALCAAVGSLVLDQIVDTRDAVDVPQAGH